MSRPWPEAVSDGLSLPCSDCGEHPRFDYHVSDAFWDRWVPDRPAHLSVVCLPCLDKRCGGVGLADALERVQWTGTGHTVVLTPELRHKYEVATREARGLYAGRAWSPHMHGSDDRRYAPVGSDDE